MKKFKLCYLAVIALMTFNFTACDPVADPKSNKADFEYFEFDGIIGDATIKRSAGTIVAKADETVDLSVIIAEFELSEGASARVGNKKQTSGKTANDFTETVIYEVTAEDGETVKEWEVTITQEGNVGQGTEKDADFVSFTFAGIDGSATINKNATTITAKASVTASYPSVVAQFTLSTGATAKVGDVTQMSNQTANNFTNPVIYKVISGDASNVKDWTVTITQEQATITELTNPMINQSNAVVPPGVYFVKDNLTLGGANVLTIQPGVVIKFNKDRGLTVRDKAIIKANGTEAQPIIFTSNSNLLLGDWGGIYFNDSPGSEFEWCTFQYGSANSSDDYTGYLNLWFGSKISVKNCSFKDAKYSGIGLWSAECGFVAFENNKISTCGESENNHYPIKSRGGIMPLANIGTGNIIETTKGIALNGGNVTGEVNIKSFVPYVIYGNNVTINDNSTLTLQEGTLFNFAINRSIEVKKGGKLIAVGTEAKKIIFTSNNNTKAPGDWNGIFFNDAVGSQFEHCIFEFGSGNSSDDYTGYLNLWFGSKVSVKNCIFRDGKFSGIGIWSAESGFTAFEGNTIVNCGEDQNGHYPIKARGGIMTLGGLMQSENTITTAKGIGVNGGTVNTDFFLKKYTYIIYGSHIYVTNSSGSATLTIQEGTIMKFSSNLTLEIKTGGKIVAQGGTAENQKIQFIGMVPDKGYWRGIYFEAGSNVLSGSILDNCIISHCGNLSGYQQGNISCWATPVGKVTIQNCLITMSTGYGIYIHRSGSIGTAEMNNNEFENCDKGSVGYNN